jgi:hypothetical protein
MVSLLRFDPNPHGLAPLWPVLHVDLSGQSPVIVRHSMQTSCHRHKKFSQQSALDTNTGPSSIANCGLTIIFDVRHPNRYIAIVFQVNRSRLIVRRNFESRKTLAQTMQRRGWPWTREIRGLKPIMALMAWRNKLDGLWIHPWVMRRRYRPGIIESWDQSPPWLM